MKKLRVINIQTINILKQIEQSILISFSEILFKHNIR